ncbi:adenylosuccinate lyase [Patescibacteria group bacterium]|nr:adenylosuccinate lyase [Patescibacteria group bacterium]
MSKRDIYDSISPLDYRYWDEDVAFFLSENGFMNNKLGVEIALVKTLYERGLCTKKIYEEIREACQEITTEEVYEEEKRTHHDIRALVNCIQKRVSDKAKPFVHLAATSYDIVDTANAGRYGDVTRAVAIPALKNLEEKLVEITLREANTLQIGRTHGQHAVPITFGFAMAEYVSRLGKSILKLEELAKELVGKFSGAVGAYNASSLFFDSPHKFEEDVVKNYNSGLQVAGHSTQIVQPEYLTRLLSEYIICAGILANLADDMRHLQRTEIGEVGEEFASGQVGSSTMPQKRNPINLENAKSIWKRIMPQMLTVYMDQISEHQRDLTNSASARSYPEIIAYTVSITKRLTRTMSKLKVDRANLRRNFEMQKDMIIAEPLYIILASLGHPNAHEKVKQLTLDAQAKQSSMIQLARIDPGLRPYFSKMTEKQKNILGNPELYTGIAARKAKEVAEYWQRVFRL